MGGVLLAALSGCRSIDFDAPRVASHAIDAETETSLRHDLAPVTAGHAEGEAGFAPIVDGIDALAARIALASRAERTIDAQYYLIKSDDAGLAFVNSLLRAADRGVRVRLLIDDIFTGGYDPGMMALESHPNIQIRIFNPFHRGTLGRNLGALGDFGRINRRMHNKSFTIDNQITIIGGRNIADEYFSARADYNFSDIDVIGIGPVVQEVSDMFDLYWQHESSLPVDTFAAPQEDPAAELVELRKRLDQVVARSVGSDYRRAVEDRIEHRTDTNPIHFVWAPYALVYDSPDKGVRTRAQQADKIITPLIESIGAAQEDVLIISPYFVPQKSGIEALGRLRDRGIEVTVVTNSLAANNQLTVHGGYAPARVPLLKQGVHLYEVRADAAVAGAAVAAPFGSRATLHAKAFVVDHQKLFIGSFNFDPRSANLNSELGVIIDDAGMADLFADRVQSILPEQAYSVFLDADGRVRWRDQKGGQNVVVMKEPQTTWWQRFLAGCVRILPIRSQL